MEPCLYRLDGACKNVAMLKTKMEGWRRRLGVERKSFLKIRGVNASPLCSDQQVKSLQTQVVGAVQPQQNVMQEVEGDVFGEVVTRL